MSTDRRLLLEDVSRPAARPNIGPPPASALLERAREFLPALQAANAALDAARASHPERSFDIEHVDAEGAPHIEMDLACGIMELRDEAAEAAADHALRGAGAAAETESSSSSDHESDSSEQESGPPGEGRRSGQASSSVQAEASAKERGVGEVAGSGAGKLPGASAVGSERRRGRQQKRARITEL